MFQTAPTPLSTSSITSTRCLCTAPPDTEAEPQKKLEDVASLLALDLANVLLRKITMDLYDVNVVLEDRIRGQSFDGIILYIKNMHILKIVAHIKFAYVRPQILSMTLHTEDNTIKVAWRIVGLGLARMVLRYIPDKLYNRANMDKAAVSWFEGYSTFYVNSNGKIVRHVVDKRTEEENNQTLEDMRNKVRPTSGTQFKF